MQRKKNYTTIFSKEGLKELNNKEKYCTKYLFFCDSFNEPLEVGDIPNETTHVILGFNYNQPIKKNILPKNLKYLSIGYNYSYPITNDILPNDFKYLNFSLYSDNNINVGFPTKLMRISISCHFDFKLQKGLFPKELTYLKLPCNFNEEIYEDYLMQCTNLKYLIFGAHFNQQLKKDRIPESVEYIKLGVYYEQELDNDALPKNLKILIFNQYYDKKINDDILSRNISISRI